MHARQLASDETLLTSLKWLARDRAGGMYRLCHAVSVRLRLMAPAAAFLVIWRWIKSWRLACLLAGFVGAWFLAILYTDTIEIQECKTS